MKHNFPRLLSLGFGIIICAFTPFRQILIYMCYDGSSTQTNLSSYYQTTTHPGIVSGTDRLYWFVIRDNNGTITQSEFNAAFNDYDKNSNGTLNDEDEITDNLEKMEVVY